MKVNITLTKENCNEMLINLIEKYGHDSIEVRIFEKRIQNWPCNEYTSDEILDYYYGVYHTSLDTWFHS